MATQYGVQLAVHLISSHFGNLVAKVCDCLLRKGTLTLASVIRFTELPPQQVKSCILVLIQHNCVQAFAIQQEVGFGEAPRVVTQYMALFHNILHRMRFAKFLAIVSEELDKECEEILEGLLQHGRLTLEQILDRAKSNQSEGEPVVQDALRESFLKLVRAHFVERCPASEPFLAPPSEEETPARKRGAKSAKLVEEPQTIEQRAIAAAAPMDAKRFSVIINTGTDVDDSPNVTAGEKRKQDALELDKETGASCEKDVLWRANFEEFVRCLRHKACIANVKTRLDDGAAIVLSAMLEATRSEEKKVKTENSVPLSMDTIFEGVMKSEAGRSMTLERVRGSLIQLGCAPCVRGAAESYSVDLKNIIELAQNDEVESITLKRYGRDAYRIFRLLSKSCRLLETDKISDTTFVEKKDTAKILYQLWKDEYLQMEKLNLHGSRQSQFLLWKVTKDTLWGHVLNEMYHSALNLSLRVAYELEQEQEIIQLPREKRVGALGNRFERLRKVRILLESSLMKLDDAIMLFNDF
ncbi:hypothetical protein AAG906_008753 [Vitis piasezkii]|uniref:DNA-directed RNA polymerase III subunit RPC3 n=3 Tax=Vitis TaxID=3603 RepID=A0ABY9DJL2_VITVI|eukprot:XP_010662742.1 PREDICTED: DNA-directed RNA polymerase III subunit RPC3 isoform X1 [Vitis vinifera]